MVNKIESFSDEQLDRLFTDIISEQFATIPCPWKPWEGKCSCGGCALWKKNLSVYFSATKASPVGSVEEYLEVISQKPPTKQYESQYRIKIAGAMGKRIESCHYYQQQKAREANKKS